MASLFVQLGLALGLGLLVGLQRERSAEPLAGMRTFSLITLLGALSALLGQAFGGWVIAAGALALAGLLTGATLIERRDEVRDAGLTTQVAVLVMYGLGAYLVSGSSVIAIAIGVSVAVLLQFKVQLHGIAARLNDTDMRALMQFALIALVILPALPNRSYGPYDVLNPHAIWRMVVLIVGISLGGYIMSTVWGRRTGVVLSGVLGGLISSTATTASYARRTAVQPGSGRLAALVIMIASSVLFARLIGEIAVVAPVFAWTAAPPLLLMFALCTILSGVAWLHSHGERLDLAAQDDPTELTAALIFGLLYGIIIFAVAAAKDHFGTRGVYVVAALSGLTDVDAITLSTANLVNTERLSAADGWRIVMVAALANLVFKLGLVAVLARRALLTRIGPLYATALAGGILLLGLW